MLLVPHRALFLLALMVFGPPVSCPTPDFSRTCARLAPGALPFPLPIFRIPLVDDDCPILAVFVDQTSPEAVQLHVVTADEDHPLPVVDQLYDAQRWFGLVEPARTFPFVRRARGRAGYRRIADVETFVIQLDPARPGAPAAIRFPGTYSGDQSWNVLLARHLSATIPWEQFDLEDGRPVLHVNTWNHLFSNQPTNGCSRHRLVSDYPVYRGSRADVQRHFDTVWTNFGLDV